MLNKPKAVALKAAQQLPLSRHLAFSAGKKLKGLVLFFFKCLTIIMSLSIPGIVLLNAVWIKGGTCLGGMPFGWACASLEAQVTCQPPALP